MKSRVLLMVAMLLGLTLLAVPVLAGDLNPPGAPAPTMKTLDQIPPTWDQVIPNAADRFKIVMGGAAVLDKETGLVWESSPSTTTLPWSIALHCASHPVGGRLGWRLPTIQELASLVVWGVSPQPVTQPPFANVQSSHYWSATTYATNTSLAWIVYFPYGGVATDDKSTTNSVWCVRGGAGLEAQ